MGLDVKCDAINDATDAPYGFWKNVWVGGGGGETPCYREEGPLARFFSSSSSSQLPLR